MSAELLREVWDALGLPGAAPRPDVSGTTGLGGALPVDDLVLGAVAAQLAAARLLRGTGGGPVGLDAAHVGIAVRSERYLRLDGRPVGPGFAPLSRFWRTADGWLRLHANYPHHRAAALRVLETDEAGVAGAIARWSAIELESAIVAAGGAAAAVRTEREWADSEQGLCGAALPLLRLTRAVGTPVRTADLRGLRVLDLTRVIAGPVATRTLASHGADVLRVDSPRLPEDPGALLDTGAGKRHVLLDLASAADRRTVEELLASADAVVQGYRPGALAAHGLDPAALAERHPHLVVVSLSAWGPGPWQGRRGFDSLVQAATGIADVCGDGLRPGALPAQALDHATGHLAAATVLAAVARRREEGGGWHGELSLAQTAHWLLTAPRPAVAVPGREADPSPYLLQLPTPAGTVGMVAPPGSPPWESAARLPGECAAEWIRTEGPPRSGC